MTNPLWGQLEKAQDNDQTIDQAIAAAIAAHEADPEAHLGEGESLELHKTETVVDHPQGSILPDKISFSDLDFDTTFESVDGFTIVGDVGNNVWPGATIEVADGGVETSALRANMLGIFGVTTMDKNALFDVYFSKDDVDDTVILNFGLSDATYSTWFLGFRLTGGSVVGFARWGGTTYTTGTLYTPSTGELVFVRVYYDYIGGVVYFYVNGQLAGTLEPTSAVQSHQNYSIHADGNGEESGVYRIYRLTISKQI